MLKLGRDTGPESVLGLVLLPWCHSSTTREEAAEEGCPRLGSNLDAEEALLLVFLESIVEFFLVVKLAQP